MENGNDIGKSTFPTSQNNVGNWKSPLYGVSISNMPVSEKSVLDVEVSVFKDYNTAKDPGSINLRDFLNGGLDDWLIKAPPAWYYTRKNKPIPKEYRPHIERHFAGRTARECAEILRRDIQKKGGSTPFHTAVKSLLPAVTVSGVFSQRSADKLQFHSGLICLDIDGKDNRHIGNFADLKRHLANIEEVAYVGLSVSGQGYFVLIPLAYPERHLEHFLALQRDFAEYYKIKVDDACKDVSRLRGYTFDDDRIYRENAPAYSKLLLKSGQHAEFAEAYKKGTTNGKRTVSNPVSNPTSKRGINNAWPRNTREAVEALVSEIVSCKTDITSPEPVWFEIGCALANEFGESGRDLFHTVSQFHFEYNYKEADAKFDHCLADRYRYNIGTFFHHCKANQITFKANNPKPKAVPVKRPGNAPASNLNDLAQSPHAAELIQRFELQFLGAKHFSEPAPLSQTPNADAEIKTLQDFFQAVQLPSGPIPINGYEQIVKPELFVESHLAALLSGNKWRVKKPYFDRLEKFRTYLLQNDA
ncbi:MAG: BT4734/BF3469 family protein [Saprospiraceae bacterium]